MGHALPPAKQETRDGRWALTLTHINVAVAQICANIFSCGAGWDRLNPDLKYATRRAVRVFSLNSSLTEEAAAAASFIGVGFPLSQRERLLARIRPKVIGSRRTNGRPRNNT